MLIMGTRGIRYQKAAMHFHCPTCACKSPGSHRRVRQFFTLYFIPIIPMHVVGEYIECQRCKGTYKMEVLQHDPDAEAGLMVAAYVMAIRRIMIEMTLADGVIDDEEIAEMQAQHREIVQSEYPLDQITKDIEEAVADDLSITTFLADIEPRLNNEGKEAVLSAALRIAMADGHIQEEEHALLSSIADAMRMSRAHVQGVMTQALENAPA